MKSSQVRLISLSIVMVAAGILSVAGNNRDIGIILFLVLLVPYVGEYIRAYWDG